MKDSVKSAEELRLAGMESFRANRLEEAVTLFDKAQEFAEDEEQIELITINKAGALIAMEQGGPEVMALPRIIMRRRNLRHVYVAANNLHNKYATQGDFKRAHSYLQVASGAADDANQPDWKIEVTFAQGNLSVYESKTLEAVACFEAVLAAPSTDPFRRTFALQNLGYCKLLLGESLAGIKLIHEGLEQMSANGIHGYSAEAYLDLCLGYLDVERFDEAKRFGELGLAEATEIRQVRNAHYLLGELALKRGDSASAEFHFTELAIHYPDFPHLKDLLFAIDLRRVVNFKL